MPEYCGLECEFLGEGVDVVDGNVVRWRREIDPVTKYTLPVSKIDEIISPDSEAYGRIMLPLTDEEGVFSDVSYWNLSPSLTAKLIRLNAIFAKTIWSHQGSGPLTQEDKVEFNRLLSIIPDEIHKEKPDWVVKIHTKPM